MRSLLAIGSVVGLVGCTTPYQRMGFAGGYRDTMAAPGVYRVEVRGNVFTSIEQLENYFHRRAKEICRNQPYDWRMDSGATNDPSTWTARQVGNSVRVTETPGFRKGWVAGLVMCEAAGNAAVAAKPALLPPDKMQVIDVETGQVAVVSADLAISKVPQSSRFAFVTDGKVDAITPEGNRVKVEAGEAQAIKAMGYRLLPDAEMSPPAPPPPPADASQNI